MIYYEITRYGEPNLLTVAVNNTLTSSSLPQGRWQWKNWPTSYPAGYFTLEYNFDFFNYAGIHRPVVLYTVPSNVHLTDVTVTTAVTEDLNSATVKYKIKMVDSLSKAAVECSVEIQGRTNLFFVKIKYKLDRRRPIITLISLMTPE